MTPVPHGFQPLFRTSPAVDLIGPLYYRGEGVDIVIGLRVEARHCNSRGVIHGGMLAMLADVGIGSSVSLSSTPPVRLITANLTLDFAGVAKIGDWIETHVDVQKRGKQLSFANCYIMAGERRIVRASAIFVTMGQRAP